MAGITKEDALAFIENMTVLELSEFVKDIEEKFGVSAAAPGGSCGGRRSRTGRSGPGRGEDRVRCNP